MLFDGGLWFVGVVAALERDAYGDATAAVMLFEGNQSMALVATCRTQIVIRVVLSYACGWDFGDLILPVFGISVSVPHARWRPRSSAPHRSYH